MKSTNNPKSKSLNNIKKKKTPIWFYLVIPSIPILFFIILEIALRIFGYGKDFTPWVNISKDKYVLNPDIAYKYFQNVKSVPVSNQNAFDVVKKQNAFRVFILGGSSAAGYPFSPNGDFGKYIKRRLELLYPRNTIEVVNVAMTAINSFTLRDLTPAILNQKPDLILIYAGHNEYYGALGAGSMESFGKSRSIVNLIIYLQNFKTIQLLTHTIQFVTHLFSSANSGKGDSGGTLMARMAKDQLIKLDSDVYYDGVNQFKGNMHDILEMTSKAKVPVILGRLTCNLKDQKPFISVKTDNFPTADSAYSEAEKLIQQNEINKADSLFIFSKDLDALKFRAPSKMNKIISSLGKEFNYPVVFPDKIFNEDSPQKIVGNNLMVDHLHPNLDGYHLLGKIFFDEMQKDKLLPKSRPRNIPTEIQDSLTLSNLYFSRLDSIISKYRIIILKNDWPFSKKKSVSYMLRLFNPKDFIDSLAIKIVDNRTTWEKAHREAAGYYLHKNEFKKYAYELSLLYDQFPFINDYNEIASKDLLNNHEYDLAYPFLLNMRKNSPDAFSYKWLGIIDLSKNKLLSAIKYLENSLKYSGSDPQVLFNLAGAYAKMQRFEVALQKVNQCLEISPNFPQAANLKSQLVQIVGK